MKNVIELGLRAPHAISVPAALRLAVDKLLTVLQQVVGTIDYADCEELAERVEACRRAVGAANDAASIVALTEQCCAACQRILAETEPQRLSQTREIAALVGLVREALRAVASDNTEFSAKLGDAMHRFEDVVQLKDISQVKAQLVKEIGLFRDVVEERHKAWESATENFGRRVEALERQLTATRLEAAIDPLSRIANRGTFDRTCQEWLDSGRLLFVVALADIDHLKTINDSYGHLAGDRAIVAIAKLLQSSARSSSDLAARFGGDEFAMLCADVTLHQAQARLENLVKQLAATRLEVSAGTSVTLTISCGLSELSPGDTVESLLERADTALYQAKRHGRNRVVACSKPTLRELRDDSAFGAPSR